MNPLSIRWRLSIIFATAVTLIVLGLGVVWILVARQMLTARTDRALQEELREIVQESQLHASIEEFQLAAQPRFHHHDVYEFLVMDAKGAVVFCSAGVRPEDGPLLLNNPGKQEFFIARIPSVQDAAVRVAGATANCNFGMLRMYSLTSLRPVLAEIRTLELVALILLPSALVPAAIAGYVLAGKALAPVTAICDVANSITIDRLDRRIPIRNPHDELGVLAETINCLIQRLEQAVGEIKRFTADASHEIRTPLAALKLEAELALRSQRSPEEYRSALQVITDEATHLCRLADQLLVLSREDAGVVNPVLQPVGVSQVLRDVIQQLQPLAKERSICLEATIPPHSDILGDEMRLRQVFLNLLDNALKFTPSGGKVRVDCTSHDGQIICEIADTGSGIAEEHLPHIFNRFYRADSARNQSQGGTGLGLSIAQRIVKSHGGLIEVASRKNAGTVFTVKLPGMIAA